MTTNYQQGHSNLGLDEKQNHCNRPWTVTSQWIWAKSRLKCWRLYSYRTTYFSGILTMECLASLTHNSNTSATILFLMADLGLNLLSCVCFLNLTSHFRFKMNLNSVTSWSVLFIRVMVETEITYDLGICVKSILTMNVNYVKVIGIITGHTITHYLSWTSFTLHIPPL